MFLLNTHYSCIARRLSYSKSEPLQKIVCILYVLKHLVNIRVYIDSFIYNTWWVCGCVSVCLPPLCVYVLYVFTFILTTCRFHFWEFTCSTKIVCDIKLALTSLSQSFVGVPRAVKYSNQTLIQWAWEKLCFIVMPQLCYCKHTLSVVWWVLCFQHFCLWFLCLRCMASMWLKRFVVFLGARRL